MKAIALTAFPAFVLMMKLWTSPAAAMCPPNNDTERNFLLTLYKFAQIAETPKHKNLDYMTACESDDGNVAAPDDIQDIVVPQEFIDRVLYLSDNSLATIVPSDTGNSGAIMPFRIRCNRGWNNNNVLIDLSFKLLAVVVGNRTVFYLAGTELEGTVVEDESGNPIAILPGTDISQLGQVKANFEGEKCVFPIVRNAVDTFCEVLRGRDGEIFKSFIENNGDNQNVFSHEASSFFLIGHSLGGSAAQYIASNIPQNCRDQGFIFSAFAFASPGLITQEDSQQPLDHLGGYFINGDWLLRNVFSSRFQLGQIAVHRQPEHSCPSHTINEIQTSICSCLQGKGHLNFYSNGVQNANANTEEVCDHDQTISP
ncbi:MAG: DUF2974 domain-containing protein [Rhodobacteraceae bacterium]|nr:DUF2974 domain-containing protein [Paracoccaceae bacterium]